MRQLQAELLQQKASSFLQLVLVVICAFTDPLPIQNREVLHGTVVAMAEVITVIDLVHLIPATVTVTSG